MSQPFLLFVELIILGVVAYLFWLTRKAAADVEEQINKALAENAQKQSRGQNIAVAKDIAALLQELEAAANDMRAEWTRQSLLMQNSLKQSERAQSELNDLLAHYDAIQSVSQTDGEALPSNMDTDTSSAILQETIVDAINNYTEYLANQDDRSPATIARMGGHLKSFALWWGGQHYEKAQLRRISPAEVDEYYNYLNEHNLKKDTVRRKINTLKNFLDWIEPRIELLERKMKPAPPPASVSAQNTSSPLVDRKKLVRALAAQGFDLSVIAAKTGMEREAVRMLLRSE